MKKKCENPNGKLNMATIKDSKSRKAIKFNSLDKAKYTLNQRVIGFVKLITTKKKDVCFILVGNLGG